MPCKAEVTLKRVDLLNMTHVIIQITNTEQESKKLMLLDEAVGDLHVTATSPLNATSTKPLIQRAVPTLRGLYGEKTVDRHFKPISFSFGPLHHGKEFTQGSTFEKAEKFKRRLAAMFISYSGNQKEVLYENVKKEIHSLRNCYDPIEVVDWEDEELACMFLVDGCALLHFILLDVQGKWEKLGGKNDQSVFMIHDLFLLENQLPFQLLEILIYSCIKGQEELKDSIAIFINKPFLSLVKEISIPIYDQGDSQTHHCQRQRQEEPVHLLALLRRKLIGQGVKSQEKPKEKDGLLEKLMRKWCSSGNKIRQLPTFRNVKELKAKGIRFKPKEKIDGITDIDFNHRSCMPTLRLAPILVDDQTMPILLNLIAYEMCSDFINECEITSYIAFLESLIDSGEDVKELRDAGVLFNGLGSDENLAEMFNKISQYLVPNPEKYKGLKDRIQYRYNLAWASDVAYFYHTHFRTPWSFLVFLSAVAGLLMTALQTYRGFNKPTGSRH
ncbi:hypothetical protein SLE2022_092260 [Rubroshorea leprosula]